MAARTAVVKDAWSVVRSAASTVGHLVVESVDAMVEMKVVLMVEHWVAMMVAWKVVVLVTPSVVDLAVKMDASMVDSLVVLKAELKVAW